MKTFDLAVIGAGPGGYTAAIRAAQLGLSVALIEKENVGGTCLNRGCIPTKALLHTAELYKTAKNNFASLGINCGEITYSAKDMYTQKDKVVDALQKGIAQLLVANNVHYFMGEAKVTALRTVEVRCAGEIDTLNAKNILLATGSAPTTIPVKGSNLEGVLTSDDLLKTNTIYKDIVIVGAGVIGVEFATLYSALDCNVTLLEAQNQALPFFSKELGQSIGIMLKKAGAKLNTGVILKEIIKKDGQLVCFFEQNEKIQEVTADAVLFATGRKPILENVFEKNIELELENGFVKTDKNFETSMAGVYAIGDIVKGAQLAHVAAAQGVFVAHLLAGEFSDINLNTIPSCVYTSPEIAVVGLDEKTAEKNGVEVEISKFLMGSNSRSVIEQAGRSYIKIIAQKTSGVILGAELLCQRATDIVAVFVQAINAGITVKQLEQNVFAHPTFAEGAGEAAAIFGVGAIHAVPRKKR